MSNIDWSQLITRKMKEDEANKRQRIIDAAREDKWRTDEILFISDQLIALEDGDPSALNFTERQWRDYRTLVRSWKDGHDGFPDISKRPKLIGE